MLKRCLINIRNIRVRMSTHRLSTFHIGNVTMVGSNSPQQTGSHVLTWGLRAFVVLAGFSLGALAGCGQSAAPPAKSTQSQPVQAATPAPEAVASPSEQPAAEPAVKPASAPPPMITFGGVPVEGQPAAAGGKLMLSEEKMDSLKPLQVLLGKWRGITAKNYDGMKQIVETDWVWDFTNEDNPSLKLVATDSPHFKELKLTINEENQMIMTRTDVEGDVTEMVGEFQAPVKDELQDGDIPQRTYKLQFTETEASDEGQMWQITFNQQNNNRLLFELSRKRGAGKFFRFDTLACQREGTSFAPSDEGYDEKTCIISQGLGTMTVSYQGKTFWVCCTGCRDAFNDDPEKWIARFEEVKKEMNK